MEKTVKIKAPKEAFSFFERILAEKRERKLEIKRKFSNGDFKVVK